MHVFDEGAVFRMGDEGAGGDFDDQVGPIAPCFAGALAIAAVGGLELSLKLKLPEGAFAMGRHQDDIAAFAPVTTIRTSARDELFAPEAYAPPAAVPGLNGNGGFINEFHAS
jgi:hypothetical protein